MDTSSQGTTRRARSRWLRRLPTLLVVSMVAGLLLIGGFAYLALTRSSIHAPGVVVPSTPHAITAPFDARIVALHVVAGEKVEKGQTLLTLRSAALLEALAEAQGEAAIAQGDHTVAEARVRLAEIRALDAKTQDESERGVLRAEIVAGQALLQRRDLERKKLALPVALARVEEHTNNYESLRQQVEKLERSPGALPTMTIDSLRRQLRTAKANLEEAERTRDLLQQEGPGTHVERVRVAVAKARLAAPAEAAPAEALAMERAALELADARLADANRRVTTIGAQIEVLTVRSPVQGRFRAHEPTPELALVPGRFVSKGELLARIATGDLLVETYVPERQAVYVTKACTANVRFAGVYEATGQVLAGHVTRVGAPVLDRAAAYRPGPPVEVGGAYIRVYVAIDTEDPRALKAAWALQPGRTAEVEIRLGRTGDATSILRRLLQH